MMELETYPLGGTMLKSILVGFLLGFVLMGAAQGSMPTIEETLTAD